MIMYYQTKVGSKRISNSEDTVETVIVWSYKPLLCDLDLENNKPIFLHDPPAHNDASQYQVW